MNSVAAAELSALLDGELPTRRADEVRHALRADPALAGAFENLARLDAAWKAQAAGLAFRPRASLQHGLRRRSLRTGALLLGLGGLRLGLKLAPPAFEIVVALAVLALVVGWGVGYLIRTSEDDCWWLVRRAVRLGPSEAAAGP
jgi:anti-sigma factor RsiW